MKKQLANLTTRLLQWVRSSFYAALSTGRSNGCIQKRQPVLILGSGIIEFEKNITLGYFPSPHFFNGYIHLEARGKDAHISFGEDTHINNNFVAICEHTTITVGKRCLIGTNVEIYDSDFHGVRVSDRSTSNPEKARPVLIGNDVFIGSNVKIMKGVVIGEGSVIANGSVVVGTIPSHSIAGGNPAIVLRAIER